MRRLICWLLGLLCCAGPATAGEPAPHQPRRNFILIMADDVGYECFGCYGSRQYRTPHVDRLARQGIRFRYCFAQPLCTPSRVKLMTGLVNARNYSAFSVLNPDQKTLGQYFAQAGYRTAVGGKWQLLGARHYPRRFRFRGTRPAEAGFQRWCLWQVAELGSRYWNPLLEVDGRLRQFGPAQFGPDVVCDYLLQFIQQNRHRPFFVYYPMILAHSPFVPPPGVPRTQRDPQKNFQAMVHHLDRLVGRIVAKVEQLGLAERTVILFTCDNGTNRRIVSHLAGRTIRGGKGLTTDAGTRVPLVAWSPGTIPPGRVSDSLVDFTDLLPTLLEGAGIPLPDHLDGVSLWPELCGRGRSPRQWVYQFYCPRPERTPAVRWVRSRHYKLYGDGRFYRVSDDVLEQHPLQEPLSPQAAETRRMLQHALAQMPARGRALLKFIRPPNR